MKLNVQRIQRFCLVFLIVCGVSYAAWGQEIKAPIRLRVDLVENTDKIWENGMLSNKSLESYFSDTSKFQIVKIGSKHPSFSWILNDKRENVSQKDYQILVASSVENIRNNKGDIWDSGVVPSRNNISVIFNGKHLEPNRIYYWKVRTTTNMGLTPFSEHKAFATDSRLGDNVTPAYPLQKTLQLPLEIRKMQTDSYLIDFGKDAFAQLELVLPGVRGKDSITIEFGEKLNSAGFVDSNPGGSIRYAKYKIEVQPGKTVYPIIFKADKRNTGLAAIKMPSYIGEVMPFRYVAISNYKDSLFASNVNRFIVHYPFRENAAAFRSSDSILNKIWELCHHTMKATSFTGIYIDGDRERIPYEADALINQLSHYATDDEFSLARRSHEYLIKNATWPTEWILQSILIAWNDYLYTGNKGSLQHYYNDLTAKLLLPLSREDGLISTRTGKQNDSLMKAIHFNGKQIRDIVDWPLGETDKFEFTDVNSVVNAYHYHALVLMSKIAFDLGKYKDSRFFRERANRTKSAFQKKLIHPKSKLVVDGEGSNHSSLHANMFALAFDLVPKENLKYVRGFLLSRGMDCSVYGAQFFMEALYKIGAPEDALRLLVSQNKRSWYNMIREGATMTMEAWDNIYKPNQDWNHAWGAAPANILFRKLVGVESIKPGFEEIDIKPEIGRLTFVSTKIPTIRGDIFIVINRNENDFRMEVDLPPNITANIYLPEKYFKKNIFLNDRKIKVVKEDNYCFVKRVGSGKYILTAL